MFKVAPEIYNHRPMYVRRFIVMLALLAACGVMSVSDNLLLMVASYFVIVTSLDAFTYYALRIKSSDYADADQLMTDDQTTLDGLDKYASDRRNIRMVSLTVGLLSSLAAFVVAAEWALAVFCLNYLAATIVGLAILKPHYRKKYPVIIKRDDRYYNPNSGLKPGYITPAQASLAMSEQGWLWGPIQH